MMTISLVLVSFVNWTHESHKSSWNDPVHITIFDSLMELIFFNIESFEFVPVEFYCVLETL